MRIGFFGDSFCSAKDTRQSFNTYIYNIEKHYGADIVNLGYGGSSIYDLIAIQLKPYISDLLDVYVFVWTDSMRVFHRSIRNLKSNFVGSKSDPIANAVRDYYKYIHDDEVAHLQYVATLQYIDNHILPQLHKAKIIHMWSFGRLPRHAWDNKEFDTNEIEYNHTWKNGIEVRPPLITLGMVDNKISKTYNDRVPNHIHGDVLNQTLSDIIIDIVDNYTTASSPVTIRKNA